MVNFDTSREVTRYTRVRVFVRCLRVEGAICIDWFSAVVLGTPFLGQGDSTQKLELSGNCIAAVKPTGVVVRHKEVLLEIIEGQEFLWSLREALAEAELHPPSSSLYFLFMPTLRHRHCRPRCTSLPFLFASLCFHAFSIPLAASISSIFVTPSSILSNTLCIVVR